MKNFAPLLLLLLNNCWLYAQKVDTIKRSVDGAVIKSTSDIVESTAQIKQLSKFTALLNYSSLTDTIKGKGIITLFAPDDKAIEKMSDGYYDSLSKPAYKWQLANVLKCYILAGRFTSKDILNLIRKNNGATVLTTLSGSTLTATINADRNLVLTDMNGDQSIISQFDIQQKNGILDIITSPLFPLKHPG